MPFRRPKLWRTRRRGERLGTPVGIGAVAGGVLAAAGFDWKQTLGVVTVIYVITKVATAGDE